MISFDIDNVRFNYRVGGIAVDREKVLLNKGVDDSYWFIPGGRIEGGEDSETALRREMMEELGRRIEIGGLLCTIENFFVEKERRFHEFGFYYSMKGPEYWEGPRIIKDGAGEIEYRWIDLRDLGKIELYPTIIKDRILARSTQRHFIVHEY